MNHNEGMGIMPPHPLPPPPAQRLRQRAHVANPPPEMTGPLGPLVDTGVLSLREVS